MTRPIVREVLPPDVPAWLDNAYSLPREKPRHGYLEVAIAVLALMALWCAVVVPTTVLVRAVLRWLP